MQMMEETMGTAVEAAPYRTTGGRYPRDGTRARDGDGLANALGWFSIGLGLAQVVSPDGVARFVGLQDNSRTRSLMRAIGVRELTAGVGILSRERPTGWVWARVAGDVMDLALLGSALGNDDNERDRTVAAAEDRVLGAQAPSGVHVRKSITVNRPPEEVYAFWRDFQNLPRFMSHLESVEVLDDRRSRWTARAPAGRTVSWEAETTDDQPNERIAWRSLPDAGVTNSGSVRFARAPGRRGTEVVVDLRYEPPAGTLGAVVAKLFGEEPSQQINGDLRRLKQVMETGEVVHSDASIHKGPHPAQPDATRAGALSTEAR
jgi:uncharacterized membrane protein